MTNRHRAGCNRPLNALLAGLARLVRGRLIEPVRRNARLRAGKEELARLDDRMLRDIGLTRAQVHAAAYGLLKPGRHAAEESVRAVPREPEGLAQGRAIASSSSGTTAAPLARRAAGG